MIVEIDSIANAVELLQRDKAVLLVFLGSKYH